MILLIYLIGFLLSVYISILIFSKVLNKIDVGAILHRRLKISSPGKVFMFIFFTSIILNYLFKELLAFLNVNLIYSFILIGITLGALIVTLDNLGLYQFKRYNKRKKRK